ncbi:MAG: hypothetical protein LUC32_03435 [Clostridiales bacterium]|nr:hypothetical protein [Clostridiales bacterium]
MSEKRSSKRKTAYFSSKSKSNRAFHKPETHGTLIRIPMTVPMHIISIVSLIVQGGLTAFTIYAVYTTDTIPSLEGTGYATSLIYLLLPFVTWLITFGFRFICRKVPLEMWRLPVKVKKGMVALKGQPLKLLTLLAELETAVCFVYIALILYLGGSPSNWILLLWIAALVVTVWLPCRKAWQEAKNNGTK